MILNYQWSFKRKLLVLLDILSQRKTIAQNAKIHNVATSDIKLWLEEIYPNETHLLNHQGGIFVKDEHQILIGYNQTSTLVGSRRKPDIGLTDFDMTPEHAEYYVANDQISISTRDKHSFVESTYYSFFEWVDCAGHIYPIKDDNGDVKATINLWNMKTNLNEIGFSVVVKTLAAGHAYLYIKKTHYTINIGGRLVELTNRHAECLLYLLIGTPIRLIAEHMQISAKTVEKMITLMNDKVGTTSSHQLVTVLEQHGFYDQF